MSENEYTNNLNGFAIDHRIRELNPISITFKNPVKDVIYILNMRNNYKYFTVSTKSNNKIINDIEFDYFSDALKYIKNDMISKL